MTCSCTKKLQEAIGKLELTPSLDEQGQPNIIDFADKNPLLFSLQDRLISSDYPGKIITSNEPSRDSPDREPKHGTSAASGKHSVGANISEPTIPTGAPLQLKKLQFMEAEFDPAELQKGIKVEMEHTDDPKIAEKIAKDHLREFPDYYTKGLIPMEKKLKETVSIPGSLVARKVGLDDEDELDEAIMAKMRLINAGWSEDTADKIMEAISEKSESGEEMEESIGKPIPDKADTGDDQTRTSPAGNNPQDSYNPLYLQTDGNVRTHLHNATPDYMMVEDHIIGDVVTGYQEGAKAKRDAKSLLDFEKKELEQLDARGLEIVKMLQYVYNSQEDCPICKKLHNSVWREDDPRRPILPSEGLGEKFYNTHPNCKCTWIDLGLKVVPKDLSGRKHGRPLAKSVEKVMEERRRITDEYLYPLKEALLQQHIKEAEFPWLPDQVKTKLKQNQENGRILLVVAAGPAITDHRVEGKEKLRRMWNEELMKKMTYTAIGKKLDLNHMIPKKDPESGFIYDAEWNDKTKRMEFIVWESDQEILDAIRKDIITSVSINTGQPRTIETKCYDDECFLEPTGTVLGGDENQVALAYIVTREGWKYNGMPMRAIPPGIKYTKIYLIE